MSLLLNSLIVSEPTSKFYNQKIKRMSVSYESQLNDWVNKEKSGVNLVTTTPIFTAASWYPSNNNDWDSETISLNNYTQEDDFMLKFRNVNDYENNLFLDNINISASGTSFIDEMNNTERTLIKIVDVLGRPIINTKQKNTPLFYIYDDGTVEKKIIVVIPL